MENPRLEIDGKPLAWSVTLRDGERSPTCPDRPRGSQAVARHGEQHSPRPPR